jgi:hypothetical protein
MQYLKAIAAAIVTGLSSLAVIMAGSATFSQVTDAQWVTVAISVLTALGAVFAIPNAPAKPAASAVVVAPPPAGPPPAV